MGWKPIKKTDLHGMYKVLDGLQKNLEEQVLTVQALKQLILSRLGIFAVIVKKENK